MSLERHALEAAIDESPDDASRYAVLGDLYLQLGDPRGELIALQLASGKGSRARRDREEALLLSPGIRIAQTQRAQWRWGFVHTLLFELVHYDAWEAHRDDWTQTLLGPALEHPSCRFLRELVVDASPGDDTLRFLSAHAPRHLEALTLICNELDLAHCLSGRGLTKLHLSAQLIVPAPLSLPRLMELSLPVDAMTIGGLGVVLSSLPSLRQLTLSSLETFDRDALFPVTQLSTLEGLTLRAEKTDRSAVDALAESPLRESLQRLDVSRSGMTEEAAHRILKLAPKFARLDSLVLGDAV